MRLKCSLNVTTLKNGVQSVDTKMFVTDGYIIYAKNQKENFVNF